VSNTQFPGLHWDVWGGRVRSFDNGIRWNVISYVLLEESTGLNSGGTIEGTIYDFWNFTFTRSGNQITAQGVSWNRTLQPGESTHDVGFCANR
jgi:hypothetical protein